MASSRPYCYLEHVKSCQVCKLVAMEDLCKFRPVKVNDRALTGQKPPARMKGYSPDFWVKNASRGMLLTRDRSKYLGFYNPESVQDAIAEGIRVSAWEYRAYKEDPDTPRRIYVGDDAMVRESELDHYKDGGYAEDEDGSPELVTPYDAGLDPDDDMPDPENADMHHSGGVLPDLFRTFYSEYRVIRFEEFEINNLPGSWMGFKVTMHYRHSPGRPYYQLMTVPTLRATGCSVRLDNGYVVPAGKTVRISTIKTKADRKRARARAEERRFLAGFVGKERAREMTGYILPGRRVERQVAPTC